MPEYRSHFVRCSEVREVTLMRRGSSPRKESYRLCPFYQRQLVHEDVIVFNKLPQLGVGLITVILGPSPPQEGIRCNGVNK